MDELSGGQKQLVYILSELAARPSVLICDEPLCGLDINRQASVLHMLQALQMHFGVSILYLSVDLSAVQLMAHDAAFMYAAHEPFPGAMSIPRPLQTGVQAGSLRWARPRRLSSRHNGARHGCTSAKAASPKKHRAEGTCAILF